MSRIKNFTRNLAAGYFQLAANVAYSLISIPLILHYLPKAEFGLWATLMQLMSYLALVDLGMNAAVARLLVDHKDNRADGGYGSLIKTSFLVSVVQGLIVLMVVLLAAPALASLMKVPAEHSATFIALMRWQGLLAATGFCLRPLAMMLYAHQREYISTLTSTMSLVVSLGVLWLGLAGGHGIYSFIYAGVLGAILTPACLFWNCRRFDLLPRLGEWGKVSRKRFNEVFAYGKDVFLMSLGAQLQMASQTIVISRSLGLEAAAVWAVGSKIFSLVLPVATRPLGAAFPGLYEMEARGETDRLKHRFKDMVVLTGSLGAVLGVSLALCNALFVEVWTGGKIRWLPLNDVLLGVWLFVLTLATTHVCFVNVTKNIGGMRYVLFLEGVLFVLFASALGSNGGVAGVVATSVLFTMLFCFRYSIYRSHQFFKVSRSELVFGWARPCLKLALVFGVLAVGLWFLTLGFPPIVRLCIHAVTAVVVGGGLFLRLGCTPQMLHEAGKRLPLPIARLLRLLAGTSLRTWA